MSRLHSRNSNQPHRRTSCNRFASVWLTIRPTALRLCGDHYRILQQPSRHLERKEDLWRADKDRKLPICHCSDWLRTRLFITWPVNSNTNTLLLRSSSESFDTNSYLHRRSLCWIDSLQSLPPHRIYLRTHIRIDPSTQCRTDTPECYGSLLFRYSNGCVGS